MGVLTKPTENKGIIAQFKKAARFCLAKVRPFVLSPSIPFLLSFILLAGCAAQMEGPQSLELGECISPQSLQETGHIANMVFEKDDGIAHKIIRELKAANKQICVAPASAIQSDISGAGAFYLPEKNTIVLADGESKKSFFIHEGMHALQNDALGPEWLKKNMKNREKSIAEMMLFESGAVAFQSYYIQDAGRRGDFQEISQYFHNIDFIQKYMSAVFDKHETLFDKISGDLPSAETMDKMMAVFFEADIANRWHEIYDKTIFNGHLAKAVVQDGILRDVHFSSEEFRKLTTGNLYPDGTEFPRAEKAFKDYCRRVEVSFASNQGRPSNDRKTASLLVLGK